MNAVVDMEKLATASIEEIEAMMAAAEGGTMPEANPEQKAEDQEGAAVAATDVNGDSSTQAEGQGAEKVSDKELNFAKLRAKTEAQDRELQRLKEENERLAKHTYTAELPADHAQKVAEVTALLAGIGAKFQEGELTWDDYQSQLNQANAERESLIAAGLKAEISKEMREQAERETAERERATWEQTVEKFVASKPDSVDYATDEAKQRDLNTYVKALASDPDNADKGFDWYLSEAHSLVKAKHRIATQPAAPEKTPAKPEGATEKPVAPFNTLSDVPGGVPPAKSESEQLDQMSGAALTNRFLNDPAAIDRALNSLG